jgi:hypothetical protein
MKTDVNRSMMIRIALVAFSFSFSLASASAFGWGFEGHRITGLVAEQLLTPKAKQEVEALLEGGSLADAATYPDYFREALKREIPGSDKWHYDNRQVCRDGKRGVDYCQDGNCASMQIPRLFSVLRDAKRSKEDRLLALRFLVHIVGDIHQPLHASDDDDLGGNRKIVLMPGEVPVPVGSDRLPRNLHLTWDVEFVKRSLGVTSEQDYAKLLVDTHKDRFAQWMRGDGDAWMAESYGLARRLVYGKLDGFACGEINGRKVGTRSGSAWTDAPLQLTDDYVNGAVGIVPPLLARAGARIGGVLNAALDPLPAGKKSLGDVAAPGASSATTPSATAAAPAPVVASPSVTATPSPVPTGVPTTSSLAEALERERERRPAAPRK